MAGCMTLVLLRDEPVPNVHPAKMTSEQKAEWYKELYASAEDELESFCGHTIDRVTASDDQHFIYGAYTPEDLIAALKEVQKNQALQIRNDMEWIISEAGSESLRDIVSAAEANPATMTAYRLRCVSKFLDGVFFSDSGFYFAEKGTAKVSDALLQEVIESPEQFALVECVAKY